MKVNNDIYRVRKVDAMDLKPGDNFYDQKDKRLYKVGSIMVDRINNDVIIKTVEPNSRKDGLIRKLAYSKLTLQEFKY